MTSMEDADAIPAGLGVVVTRISSTQHYPSSLNPTLSIQSRGRIGFDAGHFNLEPGTTVYVVLLKPGRYYFNSLFIGSLSTTQFPADNEFECVADRVFYIGDVDISLDVNTRRYGIRRPERFRLAQLSYQQTHPRLAANRPLQR